MTADPGSIEITLRPGETEQATIYLDNPAQGGVFFTADQAGIQPSRQGNGNGSRNIEGSYLVCSGEKFHTNSVYTWNYRIYNGGNDNEWIKQIYLTLPNGLESTNATDFTGGSGGNMVFQGPLGNGVSMHWFGEDANGWGVVHMGELASSDVTLYTYSNLEEDVMIHYEVMGEVYGGPPHTVTGNIQLRNLGPVVPWISLEDSTGFLPGNHTDSLLVTVDATGMADGTYHAWVLLQDNFGHETIIPVNLTVDQFLGDVDNYPVDQTILIDIYPNPSSGITHFNIQVSEPQKMIIWISDMLGHNVRTIQGPANTGNYQFEFDGRDDNGNLLPPGLYLVRINSGDKMASRKFLLVQ